VQTDTHGKYKKRLVLLAKNKTPLVFHCCVTLYSIKMVLTPPTALFRLSKAKLNSQFLRYKD
jgi:hypothetical protein